MHFIKKGQKRWIKISTSYFDQPLFTWHRFKHLHRNKIIFYDIILCKIDNPSKFHIVIYFIQWISFCKTTRFWFSCTTPCIDLFLTTTMHLCKMSRNTLKYSRAIPCPIIVFLTMCLDILVLDIVNDTCNFWRRLNLVLSQPINGE